MNPSANVNVQRLRVAANCRYLEYDDGRPFFYLGDTAWELFHRLNREQADAYLQDRAAKRFTVIQAVALAELGGLERPNAYGDLPLAAAMSMILMLVICFSLAAWHHRNWRKTQRQSDLLKAEYSAAIIDGVLSAAAGSAFVAIAFLKNTSLSVSE